MKCMSPALNGNLVIWCFKHGNAIWNNIMQQNSLWIHGTATYMLHCRTSYKTNMKLLERAWVSPTLVSWLEILSVSKVNVSKPPQLVVKTEIVSICMSVYISVYMQTCTEDNLYIGGRWPFSRLFQLIHSMGRQYIVVAGDLWEWIDSMLTIDIMSLTMQLTFHSHPLPFLSSPFLPSSPPLSSLSFVPLLLHSIFSSFSLPFLPPPPSLPSSLFSSPPLPPPFFSSLIFSFSLLSASLSSLPSPLSSPLPPLLSSSSSPALLLLPPFFSSSLSSSFSFIFLLLFLSPLLSLPSSSFLPLPSPSFLLLSLSHLPPSLPAVSPYARSSDWCLEILW